MHGLPKEAPNHKEEDSLTHNAFYSAFMLMKSLRRRPRCVWYTEHEKFLSQKRWAAGSTAPNPLWEWKFFRQLLLLEMQTNQHWNAAVFIASWCLVPLINPLDEAWVIRRVERERGYSGIQDNLKDEAVCLWRASCTMRVDSSIARL